MFDDPEIWRVISRFPGYQVSSYGNVIDPQNEYVPPYVNNQGEPCVTFSVYQGSISYTGPIWRLMLMSFYDILDVMSLVPDYRDENPVNLDIYNLRWNDNDGIPVMFRQDSNGDWHRIRRQGRRVRIIETQETFDNARAMSEEKSYDLNRVYMCLRGEQKTHHGASFEYAD